MKRIVLTFLLCIFYSSACAQNRDVERDSLPVFIIKDKELASIFDEFIDNTRNFDSNSPIGYNFYVDLYDVDGKDEIFISLDVSKQKEHSDSLTLYKDHYHHRALIRHRDVVFLAHVSSYADSFNYHLVTRMLKVLPVKQVIYLKDPPPGFYDLSRRGGEPVKYILKSSYHNYDGANWFHGLKLFEDDTNNNLMIEDD